MVAVPLAVASGRSLLIAQWYVLQALADERKKVTDIYFLASPPTLIRRATFPSRHRQHIRRHDVKVSDLDYTREAERDYIEGSGQ